MGIKRTKRKAKGKAEKAFTLRQVADACGIHSRTVVRWVRGRKVKINEKKTQSGHWWFSENDIAKLLEYSKLHKK